MGHRQDFIALLNGNPPARMPFFPDITNWYMARRTPPGEAQRFSPGQFIPDAEPFHRNPGDMPASYRDFTLMDFYRRFDWGFPVHQYHWHDTVYDSSVSRSSVTQHGENRVTLTTPHGSLQRASRMAADGSWCPVEHYVKSLADLDIIRHVVEATHFVPRYERVRKIMDEMGDQGIGDIVLARSPFGKLVHEYMGFEAVVYALADAPQVIEGFLQLQEPKDLELAGLAAEAPEPLVILSDHADENLIAPPHYKRYCIPYYQKLTRLMHEHGKFVSTHLDGNFKGFFPLLGQTGFDLLDGCTPAPMFNYEVEELAGALPRGMKTYCGVPSTLFCQGLPTEEILGFADRITTSLRGRAILNIGDILPSDGNIEQVIALGRHVT